MTITLAAGCLFRAAVGLLCVTGVFIPRPGEPRDKLKVADHPSFASQAQDTTLSGAANGLAVLSPEARSSPLLPYR